MTRHASRALLGALVLAAAACGDGATESQVDDIGRALFTYAGDFSGTFAAEGEMRLSRGTPLERGSWAGGGIVQGELNVIAFNQRGGGADYLFINLPRAAVGVYDIPIECVDAGDPSCPSVVFAMAEDIENDEVQTLCGIARGTVRVTDVGGGRARGTFDGTLHCLLAEGGDGEAELTGGTFDIRLAALVP